MLPQGVLVRICHTFYMEELPPRQKLSQIPEHPGLQPELQLPTPTPELPHVNEIPPEMQQGIIDDISKDELEEIKRNSRIDAPRLN